MRMADFDYSLPPERIAQTPAEPRDQARLMVIHRSDGRIEHRRFADLIDYLAAGDLLVANDSRVIQARLRGRKAGSAGAVEVLLLRALDAWHWEALVRGRVHVGTRITFAGADQESAEDEPATATVVELQPDGLRVLAFDRPVEALAAQIGELPLPPYIHQRPADPERYQTIYARVAGSAAAPTAGLHFTPRLLDRLQAQGVGLAFVTLHIGLDTFKPISAADPRDHRMHREWCALSPATAQAINATRRAGRRVVAVGTTAVRVLETGALHAPRGDTVAPFVGDTDLYILPGYWPRAVDALITNFHLPRSTLLLMVAALMGHNLMGRAYQAALEHDYRFYSFGDATLIL